MKTFTIEWLYRFLVAAVAAGFTNSQEFGRCQKHFSFEGTKDLSVLTGNWVTLGSTRRAFSCNSFLGLPNGREGITLEESWMVSGFVGVWKHEVSSEVKSSPHGLDVTSSGFDGLLMPGKLAIGDNGNTLLLVQCGRMLWFPTLSYTVLSREIPADPAAEVESVFKTFNVPSSIPSFFMVNHEGCDRVPVNEVENNGLSSRRSVGTAEIEETPALPSWRIVESRDRIFFK